MAPQLPLKGTETSERPRFLGNLGQDASCPHIYMWSGKGRTAMANKKIGQERTIATLAGGGSAAAECAPCPVRDPRLVAIWLGMDDAALTRKSFLVHVGERQRPVQLDRDN